MDDVIPTAEQIHRFVDDLETSLKFHVGNIKCDNILLYGMGGSAISNSIVADYCFERSKIPITVIKGPFLPKWANENTLAILSSYSGNTMEIVEAYGIARSRKCMVIVITSGGKLGTLVKKNRDMHIMLPARMHPRHSIGYMIGYLISIIKATGCKDLEKDMIDAIPSLKEFRSELESGNLIDDLAKRFLGKAPVICSYNEVGSVIFRWMTQFNENSKTIAFCTSISKMLNTDIEVNSEKTKVPYDIVILTYGNEPEPDAVKLTKRLDSIGAEYIVLPMNGNCRTENMFRMLMTGDMVTVKIAELNGVDSSAVPPITKLKDKMKKFSDGRYERLLESD